MIDLPDTASVATCTAIAQILPVFMVALVAERIVRAKEPKEPAARVRTRLALLLRIILDTVIASGLLVSTFVALMGIESDGIQGERASRLWLATWLLGFAILYRWMLLSTPLLRLITEVSRAWTDFLFDRAYRFGEKLPEWLDRAWSVFMRVVFVAGEVVFSVLGAGLYDGAVHAAEKVVLRMTAKSEASKRRAEKDDIVN